MLGVVRLATLAAKRSCWSLRLLGHPEHTEDGCAEERVKRLDARFCGYLQGRVTHTHALGIDRPVVVDPRDCARAIRVVGRQGAVPTRVAVALLPWELDVVVKVTRA